MYPEEWLDPDTMDDGTMPASRDALAGAVVGHKIVFAERQALAHRYYGSNSSEDTLVLTLDNGKKVALYEDGDCCADTTIHGFFLNPASVDHVITGVGTTEGFTTWHIFADFGDMLTLDVSWSCGNPFYYGYGFTIRVLDEE